MDQDPPAPGPTPDKPAPDTPAPAVVKKRHLLRHSHIVAMEVLAVVALLLALAGGAAIWRLQSGPVDVTFAKNYIQEALRVPERGLTPVIGKAALSWPDLQGPLLLAVRDVKLFNADGQPVLALEEAELSLSRRMLLLGQISPIALILKEPVVQVVRRTDGQMDFGILGLQSERATADVGGENRRVYTEILKYVARPDSQKDFSGLSNLEALIIQKASLIIKDERLQYAWVMPRLDAQLESGKNSLNVDMRISFNPVNGAESFLNLSYALPWSDNKGELTGEIKNFDPWFFAQQIPALEHLKKGDTVINGRIAATTDQNLVPNKIMAEINAPQGTFIAPELSAEPLSFSNLILQAAYNRTTGMINLARGEVSLKDIKLAASGEARWDEAGLAGKARITIPKLEHAQIKALWPPMLKGENAETWIVQRMSKGVFSNLYAELEFVAHDAATGWLLDSRKLSTGFDFENLSVDYRAPLWPVTGSRGSGVFDVTNDILTINVDNGKIGDLAVKKSTLTFRDILKTGQGKAALKIGLEGSLGETLRYIALEPIKRTVRFKPDDVKGTADLAVDVTFPTHKNVRVEEVKVAVKGTLNDLFLPNVVRDVPLTGGPYTMQVDDTALHVTGKGFLGSSAGTFDYTQNLKAENLKSEEKKPFEIVKATIDTDPATRLALGIDLSDFVDGIMPASIEYKGHHAGASTARITADLKDTHIFFNPFDYDKKSGEGPASAALNVTLENGHVTRIADFTIKAPNLDINNAALDFVTRGEETFLSAGSFPDFTIGESTGSASFTVNQSGRYDIKAKATYFDLTPFLDNEPKSATPEPAMQVELNAARLRGEDKIEIGNGRFFFDMDATGRYKKIDVSADVGKGSVKVLFAPDETGAYRFALDSDDAGAMLAAFGVYQNIRGGTMRIRGKPEKTPDNADMEGSVLISDFKVVNAPTLARLISALSLPGLAALLNNEGLSFSKLEAGYVWDYKPDGAILNIKDGRTSGNSVGFTFEGKIDQATQTMDVNGTMVPLSEVNKIIGNIPIVGDILTGGKDGGLVAATYTLKGPSDEPGVMVNPLSVLTPGILRRILFE